MPERYLSEVLKNLVMYTRLELRDMLSAGDGILESSGALGINEVIQEESIKKENILLRYGPKGHQHREVLFQRESVLRNSQ